MDVKLLLSLFLLINGMLVKGQNNVEEPLDIWCLDSKVISQRELVKGIENVELCRFKLIADYPFSDGVQNCTPVSPESLNMDVKTYLTETKDGKPSKQIAIFVSWLYRKDYFSYVEGYHMEINDVSVNGGGNLQYQFEWGPELLEAVKDSSASRLRFHFIYAGEPGNYRISPEDKYRFRLQPMPLYAVDRTPQDIQKIVKIPGCRNRMIRNSSQCDDEPCRGRKVRLKGKCVLLDTTTRRTTAIRLMTTRRSANAKTNSSDFPDYLHWIWPAGGGVAALVIIVLMLYLCNHFYGSKKGKAAGTGRRRILLVCTTDHAFLDAINQLIGMILQYNGIEVVCNLRQKTQIGRCGIQEWTKNEVSAADIVCFLVANSSEVTSVVKECEEDETCRLDNVEKHQVAIVLRATETIIVNSKKEHNDKKKFVILHLSDSIKKDSSPYFKRYTLPSDTKKFFKQTLGEYNGTIKDNIEKSRKIFLNLLSNAQLGYSHTVEFVEDSNADAVDNMTPTQTDNNLNPEEVNIANNSGNHEPDASLSLNILPSGPPSCESNGSATYDTADFNVEDKARYCKFVQAGARPKQLSC